MSNTLPKSNLLKKLETSQRGFTIIELLVVIIIIAILASITVVAYSGIQNNADVSKDKADIASLKKAIQVARFKTGKVLGEITGPSNYCTGCNCINTTNNPDGIEPRELAKTNPCWTVYESTIDDIATAANEDLNQFKDGDARGNPYWIDENEDEDPGYPCNPDSIGYFTGDGITLSTENIPLSLPSCI